MGCLGKVCSSKWLGLGRLHGKVTFVWIPEGGEGVTLGDIWLKGVKPAEGMSFAKVLRQ